MIKLKYQIIDDLDTIQKLSADNFDREYNDIEGNFAIEINQYEYGLYYDEPIEEGQWGWERLFHWFYAFLEVCIKLKKEKYLLIDDIESYNSYIEFKVIGKKVIVSNVISDKVLNQITSFGMGYIEKKQPYPYEYGDWKDLEITYDELKNEVVKVTEQFFEELEKINKNLLDSKHILHMKKLVEKVKNIK